MKSSLKNTVSFKVPKNLGNSNYDQPLVFILEAVPTEGNFHKDFWPGEFKVIAKRLHSELLAYLPWEILRELGKLLISAYPKDPESNVPQEREGNL